MSQEASASVSVDNEHISFFLFGFFTSSDLSNQRKGVLKTARKPIGAASISAENHAFLSNNFRFLYLHLLLCLRIAWS
jgi:hypothetical protein